MYINGRDITDFINVCSYRVVVQLFVRNC